MTPEPSDPKACVKCGVTKTRADFYANLEMADGLFKKCKKCCNTASIEYNKEHKEQRRIWLLTYIDKHRERNKKYYLKYPEKHEATKVLRRTIKAKKLFRQPCQVCGLEKSEAHHDDYSKPLEVVWL